MRLFINICTHKTWEFDAIDQAEAQEEGTFLKIEPMNELRVSPRAKLMCLQWIERNGDIFWYCMVSDAR